jgi:hypothetical protein
MSADRSGMATIFIHHHQNDVLAAEVIAGALLSVAPVTLVASPAGAPQRTHASGPHAETIVIWTESAAGNEDMERTVRGLVARRTHFILLAHPDAEEPTSLGVGVSAPLFNRTTPWTTYRDAIRALVQGRLPPTPPPQDSPPYRPLHVHPYVRASWPARFSDGSFPLVPVLVLSGVLVWALLR